MINGFINLNNPATWTSHDCVARVRRLLQTKKVGHGGTLDPLATGVLPIAIGRATRLLQYLPEHKTYRAVIRFGLTTSTDDLEGEIITEQAAAHLQRSAIEAVLPQFIGTLNQRPPMYSAIQVNGKRLYDLARQGKTVEVPKRQVTIYHLRPCAWSAARHPELTVDVACGAGTYIRSLARDIGAAVGTGATLAQLTRINSSGFELQNSMTLEALEVAIAQATFEPYAAVKAVQHLQAITLSQPLARRWRMGQKIALTEEGIEGLTAMQRVTNFQAAPEMTPAPARVMDASTEAFLGIGEIRSVPAITPDITSPDIASPDIASPEATFSVGNILAPKMVFAPV